MHSALAAPRHATRVPRTRICTSTAIRCSHVLHAAKSPCVVVTAVDGLHNEALQELADQVSQQLQLEALVIAPATSHDSHSSSRSGRHSCPDTLTFDQQLDLQQHHDLGHHTFSLQGATAADCVLCAVDQTHGLANSLSLSPVMVLVGVTRSPALSSDMDTHPAVAVARQAALLGLPALAVCLATTSPAAPLSPAAAATVQLLKPLVQLLQSSRSWPSPSNFPRAHFPFPEQGRWALGSQMQLPDNPAAGGRNSSSSSSSWESYVSAATDCWALGEDNSWLGDYNNSSSSGSSRRQGMEGDKQAGDAAQRRREVLRSAWADGDVLLCLNVPPTWQASAGFAATRPGVLWHCWQVAAEGQLSQEQDAGADTATNSSSSNWRPRSTESSSNSRWGSPSTDSSSSSSRWGSPSTDSSNSSRSWRSTSSSHSEEAAAPAAAESARDMERRSWRSSDSGSTDSTPSWRTSEYSSQGSSGGRNSSPVGSRSWQVDRHDLYGRTLPSTSYSSRGSTAAPAGANFVGQDNTAKVASELSSRWGGPGSNSGRQHGARYNPEQQLLPSSFRVQRGTLLNDAAACGDVEAVFGGKAAVTLCQTWPAGHPLSLRDELLLAALDEGQGGLPAWLCEQ